MDVDATNTSSSAEPTNPDSMAFIASMTPSSWINAPPMAPIPITQAVSPAIPKAYGEPAAKKSKLVESPFSSLTHSTSPVSRTSSPTTASPPSTEPKSKETGPKKKTAARGKKLSAAANTTSSATVKRSETSTSSDSTPLRAENRAALDAMGLSWQEARYEPPPSTHPSKMVISSANSSKRVSVHLNLAVNGRGYNLVRANYPAQTGNWYYELQVTDAPTFLERIQSYQEMQATSQLEGELSPRTQQEPIHSSVSTDPSEAQTQSTLPAASVIQPIFETGMATEGQIRADTPSFVPPPAGLDIPLPDTSSMGQVTSHSSNNSSGLHDTSTSHMEVQSMEIQSAQTHIAPLNIPVSETSISLQSPPFTSSAIASPPTHSFARVDMSGYTSVASTLSDLDHLHDSTRRSLPAPHWRIGWATEQADKESPVGTDIYGFAWRDDGTLFHTARPIETVIRRNLDISSLSAHQAAQAPRESLPLLKKKATGQQKQAADTTPPPSLPKVLSSPSVEILADDTTDINQTSACHLDSYTNGDILGFGIELPNANLDYIKKLHEHQEMELSRQDELLRLRRMVHYSQTALSHPGADQAALKAQISESQDKIASLKPLPQFEAPAKLEGTRLTFYKNGVLQRAAVLDIPPGSYYPAFSLYYRGAVLVNFGPTFEYPPSAGFKPASELPNSYQIPLAESKFFPPAPGP